MRIVAATLFASLIAAPVVAEPAPPLAVVVRGAPDAASVRARIASELAAPIVAVDRCTGACLEIVISGTSANVAFTSGAGVTRARKIALGDEPAEWPVVIALLAGNLARDEAADVLATLPTPPAPAEQPLEPVESVEPAAPLDPPLVIPPAVAPAAPMPVFTDVLYEQRPEASPFGLGLVPGLSTDGLRIGRVRHLVAFHAIAGISGGSELLAIGGIADVQRGTASGLQLAGVAAVARDLTGIQIGGTVAVAERSSGLQIGGIAAFAERAEYQLGGIGAYSRGNASLQLGGIGAFAGTTSDLQVAGIGTLTRGRAHVQVAGIGAVAGSAEIQVGGIATLARGESNVQIGGIATVAGSANVQVAGIANVADRLRGVQVGTINIARRVEGVQVGLINIGGNAGGSSFGLINIIRGGRTDLEAAIDSDRIGTVLFRHGGHGWHNVYGVAGQQVEEGGGKADDVWMYGLGFGPSWRSKHSRIDVELMGWQVNHGGRHSTDVSVLGQLRATYAHQLGGISLIGGGAINGYVSNDQMSPFSIERRTDGAMPADEVSVTVWPSAFIGVRL